MTSVTVMRNYKTRVSYPNCTGCGDPLPVHMRPLGWCVECLTNGDFDVDREDIVLVVFTLRWMEDWFTIRIAAFLESSNEEVLDILKSEENKQVWQEFQKESLP